jgi:hypothetical protein
MRRRSPLIVLTSALMLSAVLPVASPAHATKLCPPVSVAKGEICECIIMNYATTADANVEIKMFRGSDGVVEKCGPGTTFRQSRSLCTHTFPEDDTCACQVTGEGEAIRVSIGVVDRTWADGHGDGTTSKVVMECTH